MTTTDPGALRFQAWLNDGAPHHRHGHTRITRQYPPIPIWERRLDAPPPRDAQLSLLDPEAA
jgi:hypothetical protein